MDRGLQCICGGFSLLCAERMEGTVGLSFYVSLGSFPLAWKVGNEVSQMVMDNDGPKGVARQ